MNYAGKELEYAVTLIGPTEINNWFHTIDLKYDPNDYHKLIEPIIEDKSNVVYGSRVLGKNRYFVNNFTSTFRIFANHILTLLSNLI